MKLSSGGGWLGLIYKYKLEMVYFKNDDYDFTIDPKNEIKNVCFLKKVNKIAIITSKNI